MIFTSTATSIMALGVFVSPVARIALFPTMGIMTKSTPGYQMTMYSLIRGIISGSAPRSLNRGSMVSIPKATKNATRRNDRIRLSVVSRCTLWWSPLPMACEMTAEAPVPIPIARLPITIIIGKVKLSAASSCVPN